MLVVEGVGGGLGYEGWLNVANAPGYHAGIGQHALDFLPKLGAVVHVLGVGEFVADDVIYLLPAELHEEQIERYMPVVITASPAPFKVLDSYRLIRHTMALGKALESRRQQDGSFLFESAAGGLLGTSLYGQVGRVFTWSVRNDEFCRCYFGAGFTSFRNEQKL